MVHKRLSLKDCKKNKVNGKTGYLYSACKPETVNSDYLSRATKMFMETGQVIEQTPFNFNSLWSRVTCPNCLLKKEVKK